MADTTLTSTAIVLPDDWREARDFCAEHWRALHGREAQFIAYLDRGVVGDRRLCVVEQQPISNGAL